MSFYAKPGCPSHLVDIYEKAVNALPSSYLLPPVTGEVFASIEACEQRLRGFALAEGLDITHTGGGNKECPGRRWQCVHHGKETRNWRKLEDRIETNEEGKIISRRKRDRTNVGQLTYNWSVRISWKDIGKRGSGNKAFVMTVNSLLHSHDLADNPLSFPRHRQALDEYQALIYTARKYYIAVILYLESRRVFEAKELGLILTI